MDKNMKTKIERGALLKALGHAQPIVERRNTIPILSNLLLDAGPDGLVISATDLDIQTRERVNAEVLTPGRTTVQAHLLFDVIRKMPDGSQITMEVANGRMTITAGRARFQLPTLPDDQFPELNAGDMPCSFSIPAETLKRLLSRAKFAMSTEETRYYLNGVFMHTSGEGDEARLRIVSTDGHRLALVTAEAPKMEGEMPRVIVPRKCVGELIKVVEDIDGDVEISLSHTKIRFAMGEMVYLSKVIDGTFPEYERVIPRQNDKIVLVEADALAEGIDRVSTIATEKTRAVKVVVGRDRLTLSVTSPEHGTANEEVSTSYEGPDMEIGFNSRYLLEILSLQKRQQIEIVMNDGASPTIIRQQGEADDLTVIMPMRV